jgi:hypothetical protein
MSNNLTADARVPGEAGGGWWRPLPSLYRDIGLATVATELNLQPDTLEPDVAEAVERGAAALLLAGFGPSLTRHRRSVRAGEQGGRHKLPGLARKARGSRRFLAGKSLIAKPLGESMEGRT